MKIVLISWISGKDLVDHRGPQAVLCEPLFEMNTCNNRMKFGKYIEVKHARVQTHPLEGESTGKLHMALTVYLRWKNIIWK